MLPALILASVLSAGGSGASGTSPRPSFVVTGVERVVGLVSAQASVSMTVDGEITSLSWTQVTPGADGLGAGNDVFRMAVTVDGVTACFIDVACDAPRGDYVASCSGALFMAGQDVDVRAATSPCLTPPAGFPVFNAWQ